MQFTRLISQYNTGDVPFVQQPQQEEITCLARSIRDVSQSGRRSIYMAGDATCVTNHVRDRSFLNKHEIHNLGV